MIFDPRRVLVAICRNFEIVTQPPTAPSSPDVVISRPSTGTA